MNVTVHRVDLGIGETIGRGFGTLEDGREVIFGGDWRPMAELDSAIQDFGPVDAWIEGWQVLHIASAPGKEH